MRVKLPSLRYGDLIYQLLGFFATASVLAIPLGGRVLSLYTVMLVPVFADLVFHFRTRRFPMAVNRPELYFYLWMSISVVASLFGFLYFSSLPEWSAKAVGYVPRILIYLVLLFFLMGNEDKERKSSALLQGIKWGIVANLVWSLLDAAVYYATGFSLTNSVFQYYIEATDTRYGQLSLVKSDQFRSGGLNGDPANMGLFTIILAAYALRKRKIGYYILSVLSIFASVSMIAAAGVAVVTLVHLCTNVQIRFTRRQLRVGLAAVAVLLVLLVAFSSLMEGMFQSFLARLSLKVQQGSGTGEESLRMYYYKYFLPAVVRHPLYLLIGTGYMTSSYPYLLHGYTTEEFYPFDPEVTYIANYFDLGLLGFAFFMAFYVELFIRMRQRVRTEASEANCMLMAALAGILLAFFGYHYTLYSVVILVSICAIVQTRDDAPVPIENAA